MPSSNTKQTKLSMDMDKSTSILIVGSGAFGNSKLSHASVPAIESGWQVSRLPGTWRKLDIAVFGVLIDGQSHRLHQRVSIVTRCVVGFV